MKVSDVMFCNNCGKENPNGSKFCSNCGKNIDSEVVVDNRKIYTIEIFRESQVFLINPAVNVAVNGVNKLSIANGENVKLKLEEGKYEITFTMSLRKKVVKVDLVKDIHMDLKWNRFTGSMIVNVSE